MPTLFDLTPAEYYMLLSSPKGKFSTAIMLTLKDLSLKDVIDIKIEEIESRSTSRRKRKHAYVYQFTNFNQYKYRPHEKYFFSILQRSGTKIMLFNWLRNIYKLTPNEPAYGRLIEMSNLKGCFWFVNFRWASISPNITKKGRELRLQLQIELQSYVEELKQHLVNDPESALKIANNLNGYLYLIPPSDLEEIRFILSNENDKILSSKYSEHIYAWFLEMEKLKEFDRYYDLALKDINYRGSWIPEWSGDF